VSSFHTGERHGEHANSINLEQSRLQGAQRLIVVLNHARIRVHKVCVASARVQVDRLGDVTADDFIRLPTRRAILGCKLQKRRKLAQGLGVGLGRWSHQRACGKKQRKEG
jgi:hypothetical protein